MLPDKYWALALPAWGVVAFVSSSLMYVAANLTIVPPLDDFSTIMDDDTIGDKYSNYAKKGTACVLDESGQSGKRAVHDIADVDICRASMALYSFPPNEAHKYPDRAKE
mmetsp:Transcript_66885/g.134815  ORF Transcript_66885/g.134815 Transcript_66885/m.134815 type:complete len:109 (+) Transcript_66885:198-524(+)